MTSLLRFYSLLVATGILLFTSGTLFAQPGNRGGRPGMMPSGSIVGSVVADDSSEPLPGAAIALWNAADSTLVTGVINKPDGTFAIEGLRPGLFYIKVTSLGYTTYTIPNVALKAGAMEANLGQIRLLPDSTQIGDEVTLSADRADVEFRSDRTVYNVENQPVTAGGNTIDVLKNVPQIEVDINDNVSLRGSQNVAILVNNRPVPLSGEALAGFLKGLPADMVKSVEVIPNPSAKYDPDGMAGIINIVLKEKGKDGGVSGTVSVGVGSNSTYSTTGSINARGEHLNVFGSYSFRYDERSSNGSSYRENRLLDPVEILNQTSAGDNISRSHVLNTTIDYSFNNVHSLSFSAFGSTNLNSGTDENRYEQHEAGSDLISQTVRQSPDKGGWSNLNGSLGYHWTKEVSRHEFSAEARINASGWDNDGTYTERLQGEVGIIDSVLERQTANTDNRNYDGSVKADYVRPIGEKGRLEAGYEWELSRVNNDYYSETFNPSTGTFQPDINLNNEFTYEEQTHSLYATYGQEFGAFDAQVGLRAEQALTQFDLKTTSETFDHNYFSLFPSGSISYSIGEATRLRASYSRRINRPNTWQLNPFPQYEDRLNLRKGNPYLDPEYTDAIELGFNQFMPWGSLSLSPYYRGQTNQIGRWLRVDSSGVSTLTFENFKSSKTFGAEIVGSYRIKDHLSAFANLSLYQTDLDGSNVEAELGNNAFGWSTRANVSWTIISGLDLQATYFYRGPIEVPGGRIEEMQSADLALKKTLFGDRANLTLRVSDLFNTMGFRFYREDDTYYTEAEHKWTSRELMVNFSWNFGRQDRSSVRRRQQDQMQGGGPGGGLDF